MVAFNLVWNIGGFLAFTASLEGLEGREECPVIQCPRILPDSFWLIPHHLFFTLMATPHVYSSRCCMMLEIEKYSGRQQPFCTFWGLSGAYFDGLFHQMIGKLRNARRSSLCVREFYVFVSHVMIFLMLK